MASAVIGGETATMAWPERTAASLRTTSGWVCERERGKARDGPYFIVITCALHAKGRFAGAHTGRSEPGKSPLQMH